MIPALRKNTALVLLCFYIAGGGLIELTHRDAMSISTQQAQTLEPHACDQHERHASAESFHCLACTMANHRVAIVHHALPTLLSTAVTYGFFGSSETFTSHCTIHHSGKRGPPAA